MKTFSRSLLALLSCVALISFTGCGGDDASPASMTEGIPLSEIEAYEQEVLRMEAEDEGAMEEINEGSP